MNNIQVRHEVTKIHSFKDELGEKNYLRAFSSHYIILKYLFDSKSEDCDSNILNIGRFEDISCKYLLVVFKELELLP